MGAAIRIAILANASQAKSELNSTATTADKIGGSFSKLKLPATLALGALATGAKAAIDSATNLNEEASKSAVVFGKQKDAVDKFASGAATALGLSKVAALDATSTFGQIAQKAGLGGKASADFAKKFTGLSSDLASFNNTTPEAAIEAIGAAMRGESEPIRKYGVMLDDATLKARAMKMGLIETTTQALTPQQKALAASKEILAQTTKAQGDFARTSEGAANQQRIMAAQSENLKAKLGDVLLPTYVKLQEVMLKTLGFISQNSDKVLILAGVVAGLSAAVLVVNGVMAAASAAMAVYKGITTAVKAATIAFRNAQFALNIVMAANPIALVIIAIVALVAIFVIAYKKSDTFRRVVDKAWAGIKAATVSVFDAVKNKIASVWNFITNTIPNAVSRVRTSVQSGWDAIRDRTRAAFDAVRTFITEKIQAARERVGAVVGNIRESISNAWSAVRERTQAAWQTVVETIGNKIEAFMEKVRGIRDKVTGALSGAASWLVSAGRDIIQGLINGIDSMIQSVKNKLAALTNLIPKVKGPPKKDKVLLKSAGQSIIQSLIDGFDDKRKGVMNTLRDLSRDVEGFGSSMNGTVTLDTRAAYDASVVAQAAAMSRVKVTLTAQQIDQLQRGREIQMDLDAYRRSGGRVTA